VSVDHGAGWFRDADDARAYLREVGRLWLAWIVTLALLFLVQHWWALLAIGIGFLIGMSIIGRPLQERAQRIADPDAKVRSGRGGRRKDVALRQLMYGEGPLRQAIALTGRPSLILWVRRLVLAGTVLAFLWVMVGLFAATG